VADGQFPHGRLILSGDTLYGTTLGAGSTGWGSVFSMNKDGSDFTVLHTFSSPVSNSRGFLTNWDGEQPGAGVILSGDTLYGTAYGGGTNGTGVVYSIGTNGTGFTVLHTFTDSPFTNSADGGYVRGGLVVLSNTLYSTTSRGGANSLGIIFAMNCDGTAYRVLHSFSTNQLDGNDSWAELVAQNGRLFGTTQAGGANRRGTVFSINLDGTGFAVLYSFKNTPDANGPVAGLIASDDTLFGTTEFGGSSAAGTVFSLSLAVPAPVIASLGFSGSDIVLNAQNGVAGHTYTALTSTDAQLPLNQWSPAASISLTNSGDFTLTIANGLTQAGSRAFFIIRTQ
jgi:uncharacterized repeat protein (TIGR03803 family)